MIMVKEEFIRKMADALEGMDTGGFFKSVIIAQAAIESNWGRSALSAKYNNYFGIKAGRHWKGRTVNLRTGEVFAGKQVTIKSNFRVYESLRESIEDRNSLLRTSRYEKVEKAATPLEQVQAIKDCGYCTATNYVYSIMITIKANGLSKFDK